jgi:hypothetical protein
MEPRTSITLASCGLRLLHRLRPPSHRPRGLEARVAPHPRRRPVFIERRDPMDASLLDHTNRFQSRPCKAVHLSVVYAPRLIRLRSADRHLSRNLTTSIHESRLTA